MAAPPDLAAAEDQRSASFPIGEREFIALLASLMATNALAIDMMLPALPEMGADLHVDTANHLQLVIGVFILASASGSLLAGPLGDRFGRRRMLIFSLVGASLCAAASAIAQSFEWLLAVRFLHGILASPAAVLSMAIVRDRFSGDRMARTMSLIGMTFMIVPILAPSLGQGVQLVAGWRAIYLTLSAVSLGCALWAWRRLPETLPIAARRPIAPRAVLAAWRTIAGNRQGLWYMFACGLILAPLFGYVSSAQQIFDISFGAGQWFALGFAAAATAMAMANFINSRIVERFGARRVSHSAMFVSIALGGAQLAIDRWAPGILSVFLPILALSLASASFCATNFGSISMEPFGHLAGWASSFVAFIRMGVGGLVGATIGQQFDGTPVPLAFGFMGCGLLALLCVLRAEHGRLFTRPRRGALRQPV